MVDKVNQPGAYLVADIEKSEKELTFARKKIKKLDEELKNLKVENEQLRTVTIVILKTINRQRMDSRQIWENYFLRDRR